MTVFPTRLLPIATFFCAAMLSLSRAGEGEAHWAFRPVQASDPPAIGTGGPEHPIDRFLEADRAQAGVAVTAAADRRSLIRRAYFDLIGLPPNPEQVAAFLGDTEPGAFARLVDGLLASPRYGERWGRYWLDLARYADTAGENSDYPIREAYRYRDYVIDAFNADLPYDTFLHEQLAGDIMTAGGDGQRFAQRTIATGFIAQAKRFGTRKLEDKHLIIEDTLHTMGQAVLGLSLRCARCHDHKYDPITARDYYALYGFFQSTAYPFPGGEEVKRPSEFVPIESARELAEKDAQFMAEHQAETDEIEGEIRKLREAGAGGDKKALAAKVKPLEDKLERIKSRRPSASPPLAYAVREGKAADANIHLLGDPKKTGESVRRGAPAFLSHVGAIEIPPGSSGRLQLARWLTHAENPLTARVMVNRIWQHHFGKPIVPTPSDFGLRGEPPTHPELLDWLAAEFVARGWSVKAMHRLIMGSQAYQLASGGDAQSDPANRLYWRFDRRRLDAEAIRDSMLAVSGQLDLERPGQHPFPPVEKWGFTAHHQFKAVYPSDHRSVYLMVQRLHHHPFLALFDGPDTSASTAIRSSSTVAHQALFLVNSEFVHGQARAFAGRLIASAPERASRVENAYRIAFARPPTAGEAERAGQFLSRYTESLEAERVPANQREEEVWAAFARTLLACNEFLHVD